MPSKIEAFRVEVPEQGFDETYQAAEMSQFFEAEQTFLNSIQPLLQEQLTWENRSFPSPQVHNEATRHLREVKKQWDNGNTKPLEEYISSARQLKVIIGQGQIGKHIAELMGANNKRDAKWVFYMFSPRWSGGNLEEFLAPIRAALVGNPMFSAFSNV